jgi:hypothetical protein
MLSALLVTVAASNMVGFLDTLGVAAFCASEPLCRKGQQGMRADYILPHIGPYTALSPLGFGCPDGFSVCPQGRDILVPTPLPGPAQFIFFG